MNRILGLAVLAAAASMAQPALAGKWNKVELCHMGTESISVSSNALPAHLAHGDVEGACPVVVPPEPQPVSVVLMRCDTTDGDVLVISGSASDLPDVPVQLPAEPGDNCATAVAALLNGGMELKFVTSGAAVNVAEGESGFVTEYTFITAPPPPVVMHD